MARRDVELVIRAKNDASRAIEQVSSVLKDLAAAQVDLASGADKTSSTLAQLVGAVTSVEKAYRTIDAAANQAETAFLRQVASIDQAKAQYAALQRQIDQAGQAIVTLSLKLRANPTDALAAQLRDAQTAYKQLNAEATRTAASIAKQEGELANADDAYRGITNAAIAAQIAVREFGDENQRSALRANQAAAAQKEQYKELARAAREAAAADAAQKNINSLVAPGLVRDTKSARDSAAILEANAALKEQIALAKEEVAARQAQANVNRLVAAGLERSTKSARDSAQVFSEVADAADRAASEEQALVAAADALRSKIDPVAAVQNRLNQELAEAARLFKAGKITAEEYAAAQTTLRNRAFATSEALRQAGKAVEGQARGNRQSVALFGLRPYELTNLGYQINDVFTQLASGTSITQTFAQQGGQILQLFPRLGAAIVRTLPALAGFGAAVTAIVVPLLRLNETSTLTRQFVGQLAASADGARYTAEGLVAATRAIEDFGASTEDAAAAVRIFSQAGLNPAVLVRFGKAAQDVADITGKKLPDAAKEIATGFTGGYDAVVKLDQAFNFLSASQDEEIRRLYQQGKATEAATKAFEIFAEKQAKAANEANGPWTKAWRALGAAWGAFVDLLAKSGPITATAKALEALANGVELLFRRLSGTQPVSDLQRELDRLNDEIKDTAELLKLTGDPDGLFKKKLGDLEAAAGRTAGKIKELNDKLAGTGAPAATNPDGTPANGPNANAAGGTPPIVDDGSVARLKEQSRYLDELQQKLEKQLKTVGQIKQSEEERIRDARELAYQEAINQNKSEETAQRAGAYAELAKRLEIAKEERAETDKLNKALDETVRKKLENADALNKVFRLTGQARIEEERRLAVSRAVADEERKYAEDGLKLTDERKKALADATAAEIDAQNRGKIYLEERERIEKNVNALIELRSQLLEQQQAANAQGNTTQAYQLQTEIENVNTKLKEGVTAALAWWDAIKNNPEALAALKLTGVEIDAIRARLLATAAAATNVNNKFLQTGQQINESFATMGASAFDKFAKAVAEGENAATALRNAFLGFASDFLRMIAQMIIKQALFNMVSGGGQGAGGGGGGLGGLIASGIGMLFHEGGVVGSDGRPRLVNPAWFANAMRMHDGGIAGLKPNEVPAVLQKGEEVLTANDPRHTANGGAQQPMNVKVVNAIDAGDFVSKGLGTAVGEKAILNFIRANAGSVRAALG